ncbi:MAG: hypothetical protein KGI50_03655 [Patescibacteria group bacterium]|nr:hypothetical protein [Patescibacteria group bacterium]MDE2438386.1 hypothetical protein [Patescibacteria group bacterium]
MANIRIVPGVQVGGTTLACHGVDLFPHRVLPGNWMTPVWIHGLSHEELEFAKEFFEAFGATVIEIDNRTLYQETDHRVYS